MKRVVKEKLTKKEYQEFINDLLESNKKEGQLPPYIEFKDSKIFKVEYIETIENVNKFILENGRHPETINIYRQRHNRNN